MESSRAYRSRADGLQGLSSSNTVSSPLNVYVVEL